MFEVILGAVTLIAKLVFGKIASVKQAKKEFAAYVAVYQAKRANNGQVANSVESAVEEMKSSAESSQSPQDQD